MTRKWVGVVGLSILAIGSLVKMREGLAETREDLRYLPSNQQALAEKQADLEIAKLQFGKAHPRVIYLQTQLDALAKVQDRENQPLGEDFDRKTLLNTIRQLQSQILELQQRVEMLEKPKAAGIFDDQA